MSHDDDELSNLQYLTVEQALMDYVTLILYLKKIYNFKEDNAVVGFGGSYGGMLASWGRMRYPHIWDGVIAASAPIVSFEFSKREFDYDFFARGMTYDVTTAGGGVANEYCERNLRKLFANSTSLSSIVPKSRIRSAFRICEDDDNTTDVELGDAVTGWINEALSYMAMGNFPYPSSYILNGRGELPAFPVRVACTYLDQDYTDDMWLHALASFAGVYYNYTHSLKCNTLSKPVNKEAQVVNTLWNYQYCSQIFQVFEQKTSEHDMFATHLWNGDAAAENCYKQYGFYPDRKHFPNIYGTPNDWNTTTSNIVWSQGEYDPWKGGGVTTNLSTSLRSIIIPEAAHHLDLFFSHPNDTMAVKEARKFELQEIQKWINEKKKKEERSTPSFQ